MKGLKLNKIAKEIKFERVLDALESKNCFQSQLLPKYLRLILFFLGSIALGENFKFIFKEFVA